MAGTGVNKKLAREWLAEPEHQFCIVCKSREDLSIDHIIPQSVGKQLGWTREQIDDKANLQTLCIDCNRNKRELSMETFMKYWAPRPTLNIAEALARARMV